MGVYAGKKIMTLDLQANSQTHNVFVPLKERDFLFHLSELSSGSFKVYH